MINEEKHRYLKLLSQMYPNKKVTSTEIINLNAILNLPKGTEHFISDIHGEYQTFKHILSSGSGVIKDKIDENLLNAEKSRRDLVAMLIYYPEQKLEKLAEKGLLNDDFFHCCLLDLVKIARVVSSKYTRSKVRKAIDPKFSYITEELLGNDGTEDNKTRYYDAIIANIIATGEGKDYLVALSKLIQRLAVDHLHILGDIYDRGNGAFRVMELLKSHHSLDITWGNHDVLYMGAALGNKLCIATTIRNACRYNHLSTLEEGYGISLRPLVTFALDAYKDDPAARFMPEVSTIDDIDYDHKVIAKMHKAITIIAFKLQNYHHILHPEYKSEYLLKLDKIDFSNSTYVVEGKSYPLIDGFFPTIDPLDPYKLTPLEEEVIVKLQTAFVRSSKLQEHTRLLLDKGSMYLRYNDNLLFHGAIPTDQGGNFKVFFDRQGIPHKGKDFLDYCDQELRREYLLSEDKGDFCYFLWCNRLSPLYAKSDICTFERYFLSKDSNEDFPEVKDDYYIFSKEESYCRKVLMEFNLDPNVGIIVNGHMPVAIKKGETPIKAKGKLIIIDGGMTKAYHEITGLAGYTLIYNSYGMKLVSHEVFKTLEDAIENDNDIIHSTKILKPNSKRIYVKQTYVGKGLANRVAELKELLTAYKNGLIEEN